MSVPKSDPLIRTSLLEEFTLGSYEEHLSLLASAVEESDTFGEDAIIVSTFPDRVVVVNESGEFFDSRYKIGANNSVRFSRTEKVDVPLMEDGDLSGEALQSFFSGKSMVESMRHMLRSSFTRERTPLEMMEEGIKVLFSKGDFWRTYVRENREAVTKVAFHPSLGSPSIETKPKFGNLYREGVDDATLESCRSDVLAALAKVENRLSRLHAKTTDVYEEYQRIASGMRNEEAAQVLGRYEAFTEDYLEHLAKVGGFVSESIRAGREGCVACSALVHDEVAAQITEIELGGRLAQRVAAELVR